MNTPNQKPLLQLPTGTWVRPESIKSIRPLNGTETHPPRIVVHYGDLMDVFPCEDFAHAKETADQLSARVNQP